MIVHSSAANPCFQSSVQLYTRRPSRSRKCLTVAGSNSECCNGEPTCKAVRHAASIQQLPPSCSDAQTDSGDTSEGHYVRYRMAAVLLRTLGSQKHSSPHKLCVVAQSDAMTPPQTCIQLISSSHKLYQTNPEWSSIYISPVTQATCILFLSITISITIFVT